MQLYRAYETNGTSEPWLQENIWCFDIQLLWNVWLFGLQRWPEGFPLNGVVWSLHIGPLVFNYYHQ